MPLTIGQIADRISELRSKIAVLDALISYVRANYQSPSDEVSADMVFIREDGAAVCGSHVDTSIADLEGWKEGLAADLAELESIEVPDKKPAELKNGAKPRKKAKNEAEGDSRRGATPRHGVSGGIRHDA